MSGPLVKKGLISRLPAWFKAMFIKFWFAGAVFYFVGWGMFIQSRDQLDLVLALGIFHGLAADLMINRILVFLESDKKEYRRFMLCYSKKFFSVPVNLIFGALTAFCISYTYHIVNVTVMTVNGLPDGYISLGAEPVLYGLLYLVFDMIFIAFKNLFLKIYEKAKGS